MDLPRRAVLLVGSNAQGKTTVLEAVYFLAAFTSILTNTDRQLVNFIAARDQLAVTRLVAEYDARGAKNKLEVRLILEPTGVVNGQRLRKEILLNGVKRQVSEVIGQFNAVMFLPHMSAVIEGAPDDRRRYVNLALAQVIPGYARALSEYTQALTQRNALLKLLDERGGDPNQLDFWDEQIASSGSKLIVWRANALQELEKLAARIHRELTHGAEMLRLGYDPAFDPMSQPENQRTLKLDVAVDRAGLEPDSVKKGFITRLKALRPEEISRGVTTIGPHRDELRFLANGIDLGDYGSRGQVRTALLALKLAEVDWMKQKTGEYPVILLDEIMAELDVQRRADLLKYLENAEQVLLTTTDLKLFTPEFVEKSIVWQVSAGSVTTNG